MKSSRLNKKILLVGVVCLLMGIIGYAVPVHQADQQPRRIFFKTSAGPVLFTHGKHTDPSKFRCRDSAKALSCADCHHELILTNDVKSCDTCHSDEGYTPEDMTHDELVENHSPRCTNCHAARKSSSVRACSDCHKKEGSVKPVSCDKCHEGDGYTPDDMTHQELTEIKAHWCTECHDTRRRSDAIHDQCNRCHAGLTCNAFSEKTGGGQSECAVCHLKTKS